MKKTVVVDNRTFTVVCDYDLGGSESGMMIYENDKNVMNDIMKISEEQELSMTDDEWNNGGDRKLLINRISDSFYNN